MSDNSGRMNTRMTSRLPDTADLSPETVAAHARDIAAMRALDSAGPG